MPKQTDHRRREAIARRWASRRMAQRDGFTLFEIIMATGLSVVLLGLLSLAIQLYVHSADVGRSEVVSAALARNLLRTIADDLRRTAYTSPTASVGRGPGSGGRSGGAPSGGGGGRGSSNSSASSASGEGSSSSGTGGANTEESDNTSITDDSQSTEPGLYGNQYELQIDVSRFPRIDEYETLLAAGDSQTGEATTGLTSVAYYVAGGTADRSSSEPSTADAPAGLYRRSMSRTLSQWAMQTADTQALSGGERLLAEEVAAIEFRYFDGLEWNVEWDSDLRQGLPLAVEILIQLIDVPSGETSTPADDRTVATTIHRLVVSLPHAQPSSDTTGSASGGNPL